MSEQIQLQRAPEEQSELRCPQCGALNLPNAQWCGQCLARFVAPEPPAAAPAPETSARHATQTATAAPPSEARRSGAFVVDDQGVGWTCPRCEARVSLDEPACSVCGATLADVLRPSEPPRPERDPNNTALYSLFLPGAGHAYLGLWGQAAARALVSLWVMGVMAMTAAQTGWGVLPMLFGLMSVGLWGVTAHDAYREARRESDSVLLKQRHFLFLVMAILALMMMALVVGGLQARAAQ